MRKLLSTLLCFILMLSHSSCYKPAPTLEETKPQEELVLQEELKLQEETELAQRINEQYPFSFNQKEPVNYGLYMEPHDLQSFDGEWVYFRSGSWICRSRLDGSDKTWIVDAAEQHQYIGRIVVYNEWIFYLVGYDRSKWGKLYRINKDGAQKTPMFDIYSNSSILHLQDGWCYYTDYGTVGRIRPDGSAHEIILEKERIFKSFLAEDWLYVLLERGGSSYRPHYPFDLYRVHISGSPVIRLDNDELTPINIRVAGDWVYFQNWLKDHSLYRVPIDGGEAENLFEGKDFILRDHDKYCVAGDWIVIKQNGVIYRMLTDGSYMEAITDFLSDSLGLQTNSWLLGRGYLYSFERLYDSEGNLAGELYTMYKLDDNGQLHAVFEADHSIDPLAFHENGLIYRFFSNGTPVKRWISLEQN